MSSTNMTRVETVRQALGAIMRDGVTLEEDGIYLVTYVAYDAFHNIVRLIERAGGVACVGKWHGSKGCRVDFTISIEADEYLMSAVGGFVHSLGRGVERYQTIYLWTAKSKGWSRYQYLGPHRDGCGIRVRRIQAGGKINKTVIYGDADRFTTFCTF